jgi:hypothetical protein
MQRLCNTAIRTGAASCLGLLGLLACGGASEDPTKPEVRAPRVAIDGTVRLVADSSAYTLKPAPYAGFAFTAVVRISNGTAGPLEVAPCGRSTLWTLERWNGTAWQVAADRVCEDILAAPRRIASGATLDDTVGFYAATAPNAAPQFVTPPLSGLHRLRYSLATPGTAGGMLRSDFAATEAFELRRAQP